MSESTKYLIAVGKNISRIRKSCGYSLTDMEDCGISRSYMSKIEHGQHSLTVDKIRLLARAFSCAPSDFFKDENGNEIPY